MRDIELMGTNPRAAAFYRKSIRACIAAALPLVGGCANFSADGGMLAVQSFTGSTLGQQVDRIRTPEEAAEVRARVLDLKSGTLDVDAAIQIALLNNAGLQSSFAALGAAEAEMVSASLPPSPTISLARLAASPQLEIERQILIDVLGLLTLPRRRELAEGRFRAVQMETAEAVLRLAAATRRAYYRAVASAQIVTFLEQSKTAAEASSELAKKLGETGALNKLSQAREHAFYAELGAQLANARLRKAADKEKLTRLLGLWGDDIRYKLPGALKALPSTRKTMPALEAEAVGKRIDLQVARLNLELLAKSYGLTRATRFVSAVDLRGISRLDKDFDAISPTEELPDKSEYRGLEVEFQIPIYDFGEAKTREAEERYMQGAHKLAELAVNVRSEVRLSYDAYRGTYDIARHYQNEVLPLRKVISDETMLHYNGMLFDLSQLLIDARERINANIAAIEAKRDFWLASADMHVAVVGGGVSGGETGETAVAAAARTGAAE